MSRIIQRFYASNGAELAFTERGDGIPALLFVHGWQSDRSAWDGVVAALGAHRHTLAVDLRGFGDSNDAPGPYLLERFAADLRDLVEHRGLGPVVLVGHSMGATVALRFAVDWPLFTRALVLVAPVPASGGGYSEEGLARLRAVAGDETAVRAWLTRTVERPPNEAILDRLEAVAAKTPRAVAAESLEAFAHADFAERTRAIGVPALVIAPEHDGPENCRTKVASLLPQARLMPLPGAAHYAIVERPVEVAEAIASFV